MPLRHEREVEEILARAGPLEGPRPWWRRLRPPRLMRPRLPAASALVAAGLIVLLVALLYGRFGRPLGLALALAGLALLAAGYAAYLGKRGAGPRPGRRFWRGRPLDQATRAPWWRRWGRRR